MFTQITRTNSNGDKVVSLINTDDIAYIHEMALKPTRLYDEEGNLVSETKPTERKFSLIIVLKNEHHVAYEIDETQYNDLKTELTSTK